MNNYGYSTYKDPLAVYTVRYVGWDRFAVIRKIANHQNQWPDDKTLFESTADAMARLRKEFNYV